MVSFVFVFLPSLNANICVFQQEYTSAKKRGLDGKIISNENDPFANQFMYDENDEAMDEEHFSYSPPSKSDSRE